MNQVSSPLKGFQASDLFISNRSGTWRDVLPGIQIRVLRTCQVTGTWVVLYKVKAGTVAAPHVHFGAAESYVVSGKLEVRGGVEKGGITLVDGDYAYEANGAKHDATYFAEDTLMFYINYGPIVYYDEAGNVASILDFAAISQFADGAAES